MSNQVKSIDDLRASMNREDFDHAVIDRVALEKELSSSFYKDRCFINTPYMGVLREQLFANVSKIGANDYFELSERYKESITNLIVSLERNLDAYTVQTKYGANRRGRVALRNETIDCAHTARMRVRSYVAYSVAWQVKIESLVDYFNVRIAKYVDVVTIGNNIVVDYQAIELTTVLEPFANGVADAKTWAEDKIKVIDKMLSHAGFHIAVGEW